MSSRRLATAFAALALVTAVIVAPAAPAVAAPSETTGVGAVHVAASSSTAFAAAAKTARDQSYTVVSGDTLSGIAARYGTTWPVVWKANPFIVDANLIFPGQRLAIPSDTTPVSTPSPQPQVAAASSGWADPLPGRCISSGFGGRTNPLGGGGEFHRGTDFGAGTSTPAIHAAGAGTVIGSGWIHTGYGISVKIQHEGGTVTHYAHMSSAAVGSGQWVNAGDVIGYVGTTGMSTGNHLHFEVWTSTAWGTQIDPVPFMRDRGVWLGC